MWFREVEGIGFVCEWCVGRTGKVRGVLCGEWKWSGKGEMRVLNMKRLGRELREGEVYIGRGRGSRWGNSL